MGLLEQALQLEDKTPFEQQYALNIDDVIMELTEEDHMTSSYQNDNDDDENNHRDENGCLKCMGT